MAKSAHDTSITVWKIGNEQTRLPISYTGFMCSFCSAVVIHRWLTRTKTYRSGIGSFGVFYGFFFSGRFRFINGTEGVGLMESQLGFGLLKMKIRKDKIICGVSFRVWNAVVAVNNIIKIIFLLSPLYNIYPYTLIITNYLFILTWFLWHIFLLYNLNSLDFSILLFILHHFKIIAYSYELNYTKVVFYTFN